jgi:hypothetical protein
MGQGDMMAAAAHAAKYAARASKLAGRAGILATVLALVASCSSPGASQSRPCPMVKMVPDATYLTRFAGDSEDLTDTAFEAKIIGVQPMCTYSEDTEKQKTSIKSDLLIKLSASRGPKLTGESVTFNYFVALTGQGGTQIMRQKFDVTIPLTANKPTGTIVDNPTVMIPLKKAENGDFYQIYVYLEVSEKELTYNKRNPQQ